MADAARNRFMIDINDYLCFVNDLFVVLIIASAVNLLKQLAEPDKQQQQQQQQQQQGSEEPSVVALSLARQREALTGKLGQILSQLVAVLRNISLDTAGRSQVRGLMGGWVNEWGHLRLVCRWVRE